MAESPFERVIVRAMQAARWKRTYESEGQSPTVGESLDWMADTENAVGVARELERRLSRHDIAYEVRLREGYVTTSPATIREQYTEPGGPDVEELPEEYRTETTYEHTWVEVEAVGSGTVCVVDIAVPPAALGKLPGTVPVWFDTDGTTAVPDSYTLGSVTLFDAHEHADVECWSATAPMWPAGLPQGASVVPSDGGHDLLKDVVNSVQAGDAREILSELPANSVDVVFTSPPYRLRRKYTPGVSDDTLSVWGGAADCDHEWSSDPLASPTEWRDEDYWYRDAPVRTAAGEAYADEHTSRTNDQRKIPDIECVRCGAWIGELGLEPTLDEYINHLVTIFDEVQRVLRPSGSLFVNIADTWAMGHTSPDGEPRDAPHKSLAGVPSAFEMAMREAGWLVPERYAWVKPNPTQNGTVTDRATRAWEYVFRFTQQTDFFDAGTDDAITPEIPSEDVLVVETASDNEHTAPMPKELPERLLPRATPQDGVVLDPFCGSASTLVTAAERGNPYIGIEISEDYAELARDRLADAPAPDSYPTLDGQMSLTSFDE